MNPLISKQYRNKFSNPVAYRLQETRIVVFYKNIFQKTF